MSVLRTVKCPACGSKNLLGKPCPCGGKRSAATGGTAGRVVGVILTFLGTAALITSLAFALDASGKKGAGIAVAVGAWLVAHLFRLGYDWDDGIDVRQLLFPGPLDWPVKIESLINFWTSPRAYFRAVYLACILALFVVVAVLIGVK